MDEENNTDGLQESKGDHFSFLIPSRDFFVTPVLIYLNLAVFLWMISSGVSLFNPGVSDIIDWGAAFRHSIVEGEFWRLFTSQFIHIGLLHILFNLYALFYIGFLLEPAIGKVNFILIYLFSGLWSSINSVYWHEFTASAGASGAIFGMYGFYLVMILSRKFERPNQKNLLISVITFIGFNLFFGIIPDSGIDNAGHLGGLTGGILAGFLYLVILNFASVKIWTLLLFLLIMSTWFVAQSPLAALPDPMDKLETLLKSYADAETEMNKKLEKSDELDEAALLKLCTECLARWDELELSLRSMDQYDLPVHVREKLFFLEKYARNRSKFFSLYIKKLSEKTDEYDLEIEYLFKEQQEMQQNAGI